MTDNCEHTFSHKDPRYCTKCQLWEEDLKDEIEAPESAAPSGQAEFDLLGG